MANPYLLGADLSVQTYTWSAGVQTAYPVTNLKTYFVADVSKSDGLGAYQAFDIDMGSAVTCNTIVIDGSNLASLQPEAGTLVVTLIVNTNDDITWTDPETATTLTNTNARQVKTFNSITKRYWRIVFGCDATLAAKPELANVFLGTRLQFESTYEWDFSKANKEYQTNETMSLNGDIRTSQSFAGRQRWDLLFRLQSDTLKTAWNTFLGIVRGKLRPFYFVDADSTINYVHLDEDFTDVKTIRYNQNNFRVGMKAQTTA